MFITSARTMVTEAFRAALKGQAHPKLRDKDIWVGMDFPAAKTNYPGVWTEFTPNGAVQSAGIGHTEFRVKEDLKVVRGTRWRFGGTITATAVALTALERDTLADELLRIVAFGDEHPDLAILRGRIENNDLINVEIQWDKATLSSFTDSPGTPWGTDDTVYEVTLSLVCSGGFISVLGTEVPTGVLEGVDVFPEAEGGDAPVEDLSPWSKDWH